mgnify:CR=1 FL=1
MNLRVLVVDDSSTMRRIIVNVLTQLGISTDYIHEAEDGLVALGKVKTNSYDVILTDWNMPRMNGLQFVQNIRTGFANVIAAGKRKIHELFINRDNVNSSI